MTMNKSEPFCFHCAKPFIDSGFVRYCSKECKQSKMREYRRNYAAKNPRVYKPKPPKIKQCLFCLSDFTGSKYCSDTCRELSNILKNIHKFTNICPTCSKNMGRRKSGQVYCSPECRPYRPDRQKYKEYRRKQRKAGLLPGGRARSRAKFHGVEYEHVKPITIFKRDAWKCWQCKEVLNPALRGKNKDKSPELDHIIPISLGGPHIAANLSCICRACNIKKSNKI